MRISKFELTPYLKLFSRRKWWLISPIVLSLLAGILCLHLFPKAYRASTLILLEPQRIPESFVKSTVTETMGSFLSTIKQQIGCRTQIEKIIKEFHLDVKTSDDLAGTFTKWFQRHIPFTEDADALQPRPVDSQLPLHELTGLVRNNLKVNMVESGTIGREQNIAFEISFEWNDQDVVAPVTNAVAAAFIDDNLITREEVAASTTDFLGRETSALRRELEDRERDLEAFRKQNMGMLPDQLQSNISILDQLREQARSLETRLEQERQQAIILRAQSEIARTERNALLSMRTGRDDLPGSQREMRMTLAQLTSGDLETLESELSRLSSMYTERHPDIVAIKRRIEEIKRNGDKSPKRGDVSSSSLNGRTELSIGIINSNIEAYKKQIQEVQAQIEVYKMRVEHAPQIEMELNKTLRGYETVRQR